MLSRMSSHMSSIDHWHLWTEFSFMSRSRQVERLREFVRPFFPWFLCFPHGIKTLGFDFRCFRTLSLSRQMKSHLLWVLAIAFVNNLIILMSKYLINFIYLWDVCLAHHSTGQIRQEKRREELPFGKGNTASTVNNLTAHTFKICLWKDYQCRVVKINIVLVLW